MTPTLRHPHWSRLATVLAALWWGATTGLAFVAVPMLFARLGSPAVAGPVAAALFTVVCQLTWFCAAALFVFYMTYRPLALYYSGFVAIVLLALAVLAAVAQAAWVAPHIVSARATGGSVRLWHTLGSVLVLVQWLVAGATLWRHTQGLVPPRDAALGQSAAG